MHGKSIAFGPCVFDLNRGTLLREGSPVAVGHKGLLLLTALLRKPGQTVTKPELMDAAWPEMAVEESNLSVQIAALRKLLGPAPDGGEWIATVPRVGYRFTGPLSNADQVAQKPGERQEGFARKPTILVLPFKNIGGDHTQDYLVDGITEDIIVALTRFRWFSVLARNSSFAFKGRPVDPATLRTNLSEELGIRYVVEGSVRKSDQRARIAAQLIEVGSASHVWAERYDLELTELFAIQDEIAERIAGALEPELLKTESVLAAARHTGNMTAWDLVRRGTWHFHHVTCENHFKARELFRQACTLDPELPEAHLWIGRVNAGIVAYGWSHAPTDDIDEGAAAALAAIRLDEKNPYSHYALAIVSVYGNALDRAIAAAERAIELTPSFALGHLVLGMARLFSGGASEAVPPLERGLRLNPYDPQNFVWLNVLAFAHLFSGYPNRALDSALRAQKVSPAWRPIFETLAVCYVALGRREEARRTATEMSKLDKPAGDALAPLLTSNPHWQEQRLAYLRDAGLEG
ncbi:TolB amino-terminal domain-containing protein [Bosea sp. OK403]|uniref:winged helix-turn-helix domain-containing tetratricopeptide repeat protein n=1 Tax=Bosea sp. OK403 TaxID=1855286 RepID=UPI0008EACC2F|nr:winged helix-turn-helix domain-containing protein [Bosea sp. OK403]SFH94037.1 TolB amino-terminal domain-containing protein [Bosea sp. OK403]